MILQLVRYQKTVAWVLLCTFCFSILPGLTRASNNIATNHYNNIPYIINQPHIFLQEPILKKRNVENKKETTSISKFLNRKQAVLVNSLKQKLDIGGPSQPEMSSFKAIDASNMVDLFSGNFNYNIPLLDVGGYPVNIFYDGSITMEQESSWVGLGWNINPGSITRNTRGVPDDFDGSEEQTETQNMKPNTTWGVTFTPDLEGMGIKVLPKWLTASMQVSFNNYLGPAIDIGLKGAYAHTITQKALSEKSAIGLGYSLSLDAHLSSRDGLTLSPNASLSSTYFNEGKVSSIGNKLSIGTSYNSRYGIKDLQITDQTSASRKEQETPVDGASGSTKITFAKPSYLPSIRMPLSNIAIAGHVQGGFGMFGITLSGDIEAFIQKSYVAQGDITQHKKMIGYLYYQNAASDPNAIMDFSRLNDNEVTPNTPIISAPQYDYDVFTIQGEGTGGSIRAYRNDIGYVRDNYTETKDGNFSLGFDLAGGHLGGNFGIVLTPSKIGQWENGNKLKDIKNFTTASGSFENVYFRNPGETSVLNTGQFDRMGGLDLVRLRLGPDADNPTIEPILEHFDNQGNMITGATTDLSTIQDDKARKKRSQVINFLTAKEASNIGLDKKIKNYLIGSSIVKQNNDNTFSLAYNELDRTINDVDTKKSHRETQISQINVTENNGRRYIYGIPVYNQIQTDFTFSVNENEVAQKPDRVTLSTTSTEPDEGTTAGDHDGYLQKTTTPAYAHSFLLSGVLSPDYVDLTGDGITDDDLGTAVKFDYSKIGIHKWQTPMSGTSGIIDANFNAGKLTETSDDRGLISYGERESWYLRVVESKTMVAIFTLENRHDGKGVFDKLQPIDTYDNSEQLLRRIDLYSKADLYKNGLTGTKPAKPIKTVHFVYDYSLCKNTPDNDRQQGTVNEPNNYGKLTLKEIYFTFNGQENVIKNRYVFSYENTSNKGNPDYTIGASDRWGNYKSALTNPTYGNSSRMKNSDYPYDIQDRSYKTTADENAGAWSLKKILLPSGGQIDVTYESDDYAFVQDKRASDMVKIMGFGPDPDYSHHSYSLFNILPTLASSENNYVFINVPTSFSSSKDIYKYYIEGQDQLAFKLAVKMPKGYEYITSFANVDPSDASDPSSCCGATTVQGIIWVRLKKVGDGNFYNPLSISAVEFLKNQLPNQTYPVNVTDNSGIIAVGGMLLNMLSGLVSAFEDPVNSKRGLANQCDPDRCFVRLNNFFGCKYGGGQRVKSVQLNDNWNKMTGQYNSMYGQTYDYTTTENINGAERTISSGVASYEPSTGGEENPFHTAVQVENRLPLGPASYGTITLPVLDAFFPAPSVGYSKVTVRSMHRGDLPPGVNKLRSDIGKQVTEYYTAKDFPVFVNNTFLEPGISDKEKHVAPDIFNFYYKYSLDLKSLSQGFLIATNDMHGKMKSQASYQAGTGTNDDEKTLINYTENFYKNTGANGLNEKFDFVNSDGTIVQGNMGIDVELMNDTREFSVKSTSFEVQGQLESFIIPWLPGIWPVTGECENTYRAVTTTKVVNYHSVLDKVVVIDKGSQVSTQNLLYDAETGNVIVNSANNEFNKPIYSTKYPAYWAYSGMGLAYKNIDATYSATFKEGVISNLSDGANTLNPKDVFESGDELYVLDKGTDPTILCPPPSGNIQYTLLWAYDKNKNTTALADPNPNFVFMDASGNLITKNDVPFRIVRSGKRNMLDATLATFNAMTNPIKTITPTTENPYGIEYKLSDNEDGSQSLLITFGSFPTSAIQLGVYQSLNGGANWTSLSTRDIISPRLYSIPVKNTNAIYGIKFEGASSSVIPLNNSLTAAGQHPTGTSFRKLIVDAISDKVVNSMAVEYKEKWQIDNDVFKHYIDVFDPSVCANVPKEDCSGYMEKTINPYKKGLVGNFKPFVNKVFYDKRTETYPLIPTNISDNGYLYNFVSYWGFYTNNNLNGSLVKSVVPNTSANIKWTLGDQITKINSKGMELETVNPLGIYTNAQYGYLKSLPIAITNNARSNESVYAGFEDGDFNTDIDPGTKLNCAKPALDFTNVGTITDTKNTNFSAHTGRYVLAIPPTDPNIDNNYITIPVKNPSLIPDDFSMSFGMYTPIIKNYTDKGGNVISGTMVQDFPSPFNSYQKNYSDNPNIPLSFDSYIKGDVTLNTSVVNSFTKPVIFSPADHPYNDGIDIYNGSSYTRTGAGFYLDLTSDMGRTSCDGNTIFSEINLEQYVQIPESGRYGLITGFFNNLPDPSQNYPIYDPINPCYAHTTYSYMKLKYTLTSVDHPSYTLPPITNQFDGPTPSGHPYPYLKEFGDPMDLCAGMYKASIYIEISSYAAQIEWPNFQVGCSLDAGILSPPSARPVGYKSLNYSESSGCPVITPIAVTDAMSNSSFNILANQKMVFSAWVHADCSNVQNGVACNQVNAEFNDGTSFSLTPAGPIIDGWQRYEGLFTAPSLATSMKLRFINNTGAPIYFDDIRIHPFNSNMKSYVYDPLSLRLNAELDENNYAKFYEYDEEGTLVRTKAETIEGIKTLTETRSAIQKNITGF
ncbi:hypothetical protein [Ferruginibacter albus]|uniref:hypothetical protein n=1 Tax=Ferruginibacter albus TaxID=2875540 RepID=UPI001CC4B102|nr:hypothetical protein [Ferruginibacter albus]UAY53238.1 hypothetical protein K9M53_06095 [Ferruginibacter albus]